MIIRAFLLVVFIAAGSAASAQLAQAHEPTSATDGDVKLHNTKKSRFMRSSRARKTERLGESVKDTRSAATVRETERHGKSIRKGRGTKKLNGEARVFKKHTSSATNTSTKKSKVRRSFGRDTNQ